MHAITAFQVAACPTEREGGGGKKTTTKKAACVGCGGVGGVVSDRLFAVRRSPKGCDLFTTEQSPRPAGRRQLRAPHHCKFLSVRRLSTSVSRSRVTGWPPNPLKKSLIKFQQVGGGGSKLSSRMHSAYQERQTMPRTSAMEFSA